MKKVATTQQVVAALRKAGVPIASRYTRRYSDGVQDFRGAGIVVQKGGHRVYYGKLHGSEHIGDPTPVVSQGSYHEGKTGQADCRRDWAQARRVIKAAGLTVVWEA